MPGRLTQTVVLTIVFIITYYLTTIKWVPTIRRLVAIDNMEDAIGRSLEMGKPVCMIPGTGSLNNVVTGPALIAGLAVTSYVAQICAKLDQRMIVALGSSDAISLTESLIKQSFLIEGKSDNYDPNMINYFPGRETGMYGLAFTNSAIGLIEREKPGALILVGYFGGEQIALGEVAAKGGAIIIGGVPTPGQMAVMATISDYMLIGEEIFVAGAYITNDPTQLKTIAVGDIFKYLGVSLILLGIILKIIGIDFTSVMGV